MSCFEFRPICLRPRPPLLLLLLTVTLTLLVPLPASASIWTEFEKGIGRMALREMILRNGEVKDPLLQEWVERTGAPVARQSTRKLTYSFTIIDLYEDNAFSLPGGHICVTRGLLNHVASDEELAGVLAHEIAHAEDEDFRRLLQEQLLFMGAQGLLRKSVSDEWIMATQLGQVMQGLHTSRKIELQADLMGTNLAYAARYDPEGLLSFLRGLHPPARGPHKLFATHPPPAKRLQAVQERIQSLQADDYDGLVAIGDSLRERLHYCRAGRLYEQAEQLAPARPEAPQRLRDLRQRQGLPPSGAPAPATQTLALSEAERADVARTLADLQAREQHLQEAEKKLRQALTRFWKDRQIAQALEVAQIISPEIKEVRYLATVARAYLMLARAWKEAMRGGEILSRSAAIRTAWGCSGRDLQRAYEVAGLGTENVSELRQTAAQFATLQQELTATTAAVNRSAVATGDLSTATRLLAAAFLALVASGEGQPLGRLNYTRFLILQGDIAIAETRIQRVAKTGRQVHDEIIRQHLQALGLQMSILHATARPELRELDRRQMVRRLPDLEAVLAAHGSARPLGETVLAARLSDKNADPHALQGLDSVARICYLDMKAER